MKPEKMRYGVHSGRRICFLQGFPALENEAEIELFRNGNRALSSRHEPQNPEPLLQKACFRSSWDEGSTIKRYQVFCHALELNALYSSAFDGILIVLLLLLLLLLLLVVVVVVVV